MTAQIFSEDFETVNKNEVISLSGWTVVNSEGKNEWLGKEYGGNLYAQMAGYQGDDSEIDWLVTPAIDLAGKSNVILSFETKDGYNNGDALEVFISEDFNGDVNTANWTNLNPALSTGNNSGYASSYTNSGEIDLSSYTGNIYIAFKYTGGTASATTTFQIDNIIVKEKVVVPTETVDLLSEDFETVVTNEPFNLANWTVISKEGSNGWLGKTYGGTIYAQISGYKGDEVETDWLVSPCIDLTGYNNPVLNFDSKDGYNNGDVLEVLISEDFNGDVDAAIWNTLNPTIATGSTGGYASDFTNSGNIDLSAYSGLVYIAFKYSGGNSIATTTFQIDNILVTGEGEVPTVVEPEFIYSEDFETVTANQTFRLPNWKVINESGANNWEGKTYGGTFYAQISGYNGDDSEIDWLVSPAIDLNGSSNPILNFDSKDGYNNGDVLEAFISEDFTGDIKASTWTKLNPVLATGSSGGYATDFTNSGNIDLSSYSGQVYIAFKYSGGTSIATTTFQIDNIVVKEGVPTSYFSATSNNIKVFPNPMNNVLSVIGENVESVSIYSLTGDLVKNVEVGFDRISVSELPKGAYVIKVNGDSSTTFKVIKK